MQHSDLSCLCVAGLPICSERLHAHAWVDKCVVDYLNRRLGSCVRSAVEGPPYIARYLRKLKMITFADEAAAKQRLLQDCRNEVLSMLKDLLRAGLPVT